MNIEKLTQAISADTSDEALENLIEISARQYAEQQLPSNRKQRRKLMHKVGRKNYDEFSEKIKQLYYIKAIEKLRKLNEEEKKNEATIKDN